MHFYPRLGFASLTIAIFIVLDAAWSRAASEDRFSVIDYFDVNRIQDLALSSDGAMIAYITKRVSFEDNKTFRTVYIGNAVPDAAPQVIGSIQDAQSISWVPGKRELAFLSSRSGTAQIYSYNLSTDELQQITDNDDPVVEFGFALDGKSLAYLTQEKSISSSLYEQMLTGRQGMLIDPDVFRFQHFMDQNWRVDQPTPRRRLWISSGMSNPFLANVPGNVEGFQWASDSLKLAVTYVPGEPLTSIYSDKRRSVGIYNLKYRELRILVKGKLARPSEPGMDYETAGWLPDRDKLIVRRASITDYFVSPRHPEWAVVDVLREKPLEEDGLIWYEMSRTGLDPTPLFHPLANGRILINKTRDGGYRSLYEVAETGSVLQSELAEDLNGNITRFRVIADGGKAVFVHDSLNKPPEIYLWRKGDGLTQLTNLNRNLAVRRFPAVNEVHWKSKDGTTVQGWLLLPNDPSPNRKPWPFITFVHGGPSMAMPVGFADYFDLWPYPFEVYALSGMAVFFPNYRGNTTFGRNFAKPNRQDGEPVDDIVSGIKHLIKEGVADPKRLAISGHSHGAWLAPMVMTRFKKFEAASFAEGWGNEVTVYDITSGRLNHELHDVIFGASLYDDPKRYLRLSPVLHFKDLNTAAMFEAGSRSMAITMLSYPKAARYTGMPTEFIVYPKTGHNPRIPRIQEESAERNLDWFRFWLQGYEDPDPGKADQYARWRNMRSERCAWDEPEDEKPSYCEYSNAVH